MGNIGQIDRAFFGEKNFSDYLFFYENKMSLESCFTSFLQIAKIISRQELAFIKKIKIILRSKRLYQLLAALFLIIGSNLFLQLCQNQFSFSLAFKFAFSWHTEKFFLGCFVLLVFYSFLASFLGSWLWGAATYLLTVIGVGVANFLKMKYRMEPIYPDDLKMITAFKMLKDILGTGPFLAYLGLLLAGVVVIIWGLYRSFRLPKKNQFIRAGIFLLATVLLGYINTFNNPQNILRKAYNQTALWIPYSQKMNYYNTGFMGGFLYNLKIDPMAKPKDYSKQKIQQITTNYDKKAAQVNQDRSEEKPNIIYVMSESFSDPARLKGLTIAGGDPLVDYRYVAQQTYSGQMLSQNYGGGTANIEFEALTGFSMALFNPQLTTPYTQLLPKLEKFPSLVSRLKTQHYQTTAIHPYNTSMYKRQTVYDRLGFDQFLDQDTIQFKKKLEHNPYISDEAAYQQILKLLNKKAPQFVHLVTMQTHMPYADKYQQIPYRAFGDNNATVNNYLQDIAYSSTALKNFLAKLDQLPKRTLVVFWGDHLPGIYSEAIQAKNSTANLHQTEFLFYDNRHRLQNSQQHHAIISPFYYQNELFDQSGLQVTGFNQLQSALQISVPAFEKQLVYQKGQWRKELQLTAAQQKVYHEYQLIQYDIVAGQQYSLQAKFFD